MIKENKNDSLKNEKFRISLGFLINNLNLEHIEVPEEEKLIYQSILDGKIDIDEYKKAVLA